MTLGIILIRDKEMFILVKNENGDLLPIHEDTEIELHLGDHWIPGKVEIERDEDDKITHFHLTCSQNTFCILYQGMHIRIANSAV